MSIKHCIIHKLDRSKPNGNVQIHLRPDELDHEGPIVSLLEQFKLTLQRSTQKQYGLFDPDKGDNPIPALLKQLEEKKLGFSSVSHQIVQHLKLSFEKQPEPFNAHILIAVDSLVEQDFFYIFWINHTEAQHINNELDTQRLEYVDTSKLTYAMKIDIEQWKVTGWDQYMSLVASRGAKELSEAFTQFTGFLSSVDLKQQTEDFLTTVDDYVDSQDAEISQQLKSKIVEYCIDQDKSGQPVDISNLSEQLDDENPEQFANFVVEKKPELKPEIYTDRSSLKKYVRFFGRDKNLSISFSSNMFGDHILFDEQKDQLVLKQIPKSLKAQLVRYLKKEKQQIE